VATSDTEQEQTKQKRIVRSEAIHWHKKTPHWHNSLAQKDPQWGEKG
jgi:hypothetical protein